MSYGITLLQQDVEINSHLRPLEPATTTLRAPAGNNAALATFAVTFVFAASPELLHLDVEVHVMNRVRSIGLLHEFRAFAATLTDLFRQQSLRLTDGANLQTVPAAS